MIIHDEVELEATEENLESTNNEPVNKTHPWRICPVGKHFVRTHSLHIPPSKEHPEGITTIRHAHCADNPSKKDLLSSDEMLAMNTKHFSDLSGSPASGVLTEFPKADDYDESIRGWVQYWNSIFHPEEPLNPNLVKALIATESGFDPNPTKVKSAHGLMQITNLTLSILGNHQGELKDHLLFLTRDDLLALSINICAGIRWLFRKKETASAKLGRKATWEEAIIDYKGYWDDFIHNQDPKPMQRLREYFQSLQEKQE